jgi:hypothetical protein
MAARDATPTKLFLFQASIKREIGHSPTNLASSFSVENVVDRSASAGTRPAP